MIMERPVRNTGQSVAPRHSIRPFQHGGPSSANSVSRTLEWMPSAPIRMSPRSGVHMRAAAVEEVGGDAALVLRERAEPAAGVDGLSAQPLDHGLMNDALQPAAMDRELRHVMAGIEPALFVPDLLAVAGQIEQLVGADRDLIEPVQQADRRRVRGSRAAVC